MYLAILNDHCVKGTYVTSAWQTLCDKGYANEDDFDKVIFYEIGKPLEVELRVIPVKKGS